MQQERNNNIKTIIVSSVVVSFFSFIFFVLLGTFYKATDHTVGLNVVVWSLTIFTAYYFYYGIHWIFTLLFKKVSKPQLINSWAIVCGFITIAVVCLFNSSSVDDYLYVEIMSGISGVVSIGQILYSVLSIKKKNNKD